MRSLVLLIIIAVVAGYFLIKQNRKEHEDHFWMSQLKTQLETFSGPEASLSSQTDESSYFKLLMFVRKAQAAGVDLTKMFNDAGKELAWDESAPPLVQESLVNNLEVAKNLQVFDDPSNLMNLEHGETATISAPGWTGEKLAVAQIIPSYLTPEVAHCIPNLVIVPAIVRDAWGVHFSPYAVERARSFLNSRLISKSAYEEIQAAMKPPKK